MTESTLDITSVIKTQKTIIPINNAATSSELFSVNAVPAKNMSSNAMIVGNRPLHGIKLFVRIAISRSFGDSMILQPVTPQALQPRPIAIARLCFPCAPHFEKYLSRLNAILGRYPESSTSENNGKNIAIGGSITDTTQDRVV